MKLEQNHLQVYCGGAELNVNLTPTLLTPTRDQSNEDCNLIEIKSAWIWSLYFTDEGDACYSEVIFWDPDTLTFGRVAKCDRKDLGTCPDLKTALKNVMFYLQSQLNNFIMKGCFIGEDLTQILQTDEDAPYEEFIPII